MPANFIFLTVTTISIVEDVTTLSDLHNIGPRRGCTEGITHVMRGPLRDPSCLLRARVQSANNISLPICSPFACHHPVSYESDFTSVSLENAGTRM